MNGNEPNDDGAGSIAHDERERDEQSATTVEYREVIRAIPTLARLAWFSGGLLVGAAIVLLLVARPWSRPRSDERVPMYEGFPFADNSGVCQEWVAIAASMRVPQSEAQATLRRVSTILPQGVRAENLRVVRAFSQGDHWTIAVDAQPGAGDEARARSVAEQLNGVATIGLRFEPVFYSVRRLYESARVLCMPRANVDEHPAH